MEKGRIKEVFPGGNTSQGFFSFYDYIAPSDATRIMIIKGGPGVGKSSFMRAIAAEVNGYGYDVELHHCSSDNNSLDGVVFPQIKVALIDGTSPHVVDPRNPGAVDEIIHLGDYWDEKGMRQGREKILELNKAVGRLFGRAYRYLKAAKVIHDDLESIYSESMDTGLANQKTADLMETIFEGSPVARKTGAIRKLFASAITPDGYRNFLPSIFKSSPAIYAITGAAGTGKSTLIQKLANAAVERGFDCEAYYCALDPSKIEHLVIEKLGVAVTTAEPPHRIDLDKAVSVVSMDECIAPGVPDEYRQPIAYNLKMKAELLETAIACLLEAKLTHDQMEQYYIPNMNFQAISVLQEKTLRRILKYAEEQALVSC
ncbi:MAG: PRK06851 family protein [Bacillota bacterium]